MITLKLFSYPKHEGPFPFQNSCQFSLHIHYSTSFKKKIFFGHIIFFLNEHKIPFHTPNYICGLFPNHKFWTSTVPQTNPIKFS